MYKINQWFSFFNKRIRLIVAISCIMLSLLGFWYLLNRDSSQRSFSGLDILHDSSIETRGFVALQLLRDSQDVDVSIKVQDWEDVSSNCGVLEFHFPGRTIKHTYYINIKNLNDPRIGIPGEGVKPLSNAMIFHDDLLDQDIIRIDPSKLEEFGGIINFIWVNGLQKIDFDKYRIHLQFGATNTPEFQLKHTTNYSVNLVSPDTLDLSAQTPAATGLQSFGNYSLYWWDITPERGLLNLIFENGNKKRMKEFLLILFGTMFGIGCTLVVERIVSVSRTSQAEPSA